MFISSKSFPLPQIFSHMTDRYILESSVTNMSTADVISALHTAGESGMRELKKHYGGVLGGKRLAGHTFIQVGFKSGFCYYIFC
jgi:hypothetical protein